MKLSQTFLKGCLAALALTASAQSFAIPFSDTKTFNESGERLLDLNGAIEDFNWNFSGLAPAVGDLTLTFSWERMDFDSDSQIEDVSVVSGVTSIGTFGDDPGVCVAAGNFFSDCTGSEDFTLSSSLIIGGILELDLTSRGVNSSGDDDSAFGFISATLAYETAGKPTPPQEPVPAPMPLALMGLGLIALIRHRRS